MLSGDHSIFKKTRLYSPKTHCSLADIRTIQPIFLTENQLFPGPHPFIKKDMQGTEKVFINTFSRVLYLNGGKEQLNSEYGCDD